jgi:hypothetical protein
MRVWRFIGLNNPAEPHYKETFETNIIFGHDAYET